MHLFKATLAAVTLTVLPLSLASPFPASAFQPADPCPWDSLAANDTFLTKTGVNCMIAQDPDCWDKLKVSDYVRAWIKGPKGRMCGTQGLAEKFGDCFLASYSNIPYCSVITTANCAPDTVALKLLRVESDIFENEDGTSPAMDCLERQQFFTVMTNLAAMNAFFSSWYTASIAASSATAAKVTAIVSIAAPPPGKEQFWKKLMVDSLLAGLAFLPGINVGANAATKVVSSALRNAKKLEAPARMIMASSTSVYTKLFPLDGTAASNLLAAGQLQQYLGEVKDDLMARLSPALETAVNDVEAFLSMAGTGAFTSPSPPKLAEHTANLEQALTTYVVSIALSGTSWFVGRAPDTNINSILYNNMDYDGCTQITPASLGWCGPVWQDTPNNQAFSLVQQTSALNHPYDLYQKLFTGDKPLTTPELLFVGAAKCRSRPGWENGPGEMLVDGVPNFDCLSQMKVCTWNPSCQISRDDNTCEYLEADCTPEAGYGFDGSNLGGYEGGLSFDDNYFYVPPGYLGPFKTGDLGGLELSTKSDDD
ncbi:MAG: hypothetical protein Q9172_006866 [Xanthocarpia lactea]